MSWEGTDQWPDGRSGGVFRGAAEMVVAERGAPTWVERVRLWWYSTPDHPLATIPERVALTPNWVYAQRAGGPIRRTRVEQLVGARREARRVIYAVAEGDDLVLPDREGDALERALDAQLGAWTPTWRSRNSVAKAVGQTLAGLLFCVLVMREFRELAMGNLRRGALVTEANLWFYAAALGGLCAIANLFYRPQQWVVDSLGATSVRGLFGWFRSTIPAERVQAVRIRRQTLQRKGSQRHYVAVELDVSGSERPVRIHSRTRMTDKRFAVAVEEADAIAALVERIFSVPRR